nr:unnamed protein product [Callosobruchus chinensis]
MQNQEIFPQNDTDGGSWAASQGLIPTVPPFCSVHKQHFKLFTEGQHGLGRFKCIKKHCRKQLRLGLSKDNFSHTSWP